MKIYKDENLTEEIKIFDFGVLDAGSKKEFEYYLFNETDAELENISVIIEHSEVKILKFPEKMKSKQKEKIVIEWSPSISIKRGLQAIIEVKCSELYF